MKKSLCTLLAVIATTSSIGNADNYSDGFSKPPKAQVITYESEMYEYVLNEFLSEKPNAYRAEMYKEERPIALADYAAFTKATSNSEHDGFDVLVFDGKKQKLHHLNKRPAGNVELVKSYTCSSARHGFSNIAESKKTATGLMFIESRQGEGAQVGKIFDYKYLKRKPRRIVPGKTVSTGSDWMAYMTTRRLDFESWRGQAFHGTNHEGYLGRPRSHGCIRLSNTDIITLFNSVTIGTPVYISPNFETESGISRSDY